MTQIEYIKRITNQDGTINHSAPASLRPGTPLKNANTRQYHPPVIRFGIPDVPDKCKPSYARIDNETVIHDPDNYEILHTVVIESGINVILNGHVIATAPQTRTDKTTGKTKKVSASDKLRFCMAVVWALINDEGNLRDHITKYPKVESITPLVSPDICIESITASPYPGPGVFHDCCFNDELTSLVDTDNLRSLLDEELSDLYIREYDPLDQDTQHETAEEIIKAFSPVRSLKTFPPGYIPHLNLYIEEVPA